MTFKSKYLANASVALLTSFLFSLLFNTRATAQTATTFSTTRKGLVGSGDRSDYIRTYNFPQGRLTEYLTHYDLQFVMMDEINEVAEGLLLAKS